MSGNPRCTVYIGNLDVRVSDRVLYDILIQAGRLVELCIPKDKVTDRPRGYAFAEYETEEIADYSVRLFSGLVTLYNRTLKFEVHRMNEEIPQTLDHHRLLVHGTFAADQIQFDGNVNVELLRHCSPSGSEQENILQPLKQLSPQNP